LFNQQGLFCTIMKTTPNPLYLAIVANKSRQHKAGTFSRKSLREEGRKRFKAATKVPGKGHETRNPTWGEGPFKVVRPGHHKVWE
jgi:hypothetical protein